MGKEGLSLLNKKRVRGFILDTVKKDRRGWDCTQVSQQAIDDIEGRLRYIIEKSVRMHPTKGVTFKHVL